MSIHDSNVQQYLRSQFASPQGKLAVKKTRIARIQEMMWVLAIIPALHPPPFTKKKKMWEGGKTNFWVLCTGVRTVLSGPEGQNQLPILST